MQKPQAEEVSAVLAQVGNWPVSKRLALARDILETLGEDVADKGRLRGSVKDLLGLLGTDQPPSSDEQCERILEDELLRKHGA